MKSLKMDMNMTFHMPEEEKLLEGVEKAVTDDEEPFQEVRRRKHKKAGKPLETIVGSLEDSQIKGMTRLTFLHVYKMEPETTSEALISFL
ncbi:unnamed protein product [Ceutorhynchus assimilis]|uniref:Uncharacterized protein n=1 Tax=Ceutorhynchus assimilis TaxID=467358 RepID=A0A9N9QKT5_9CUCU|nr:unnamed protein product [Ceutorhynchus assimilis]